MDNNNFEALKANHQFYPWYLIILDIGQGIGTVVGLLANVLLLVLILAPPRLITLPNTLLLQRAIADVIWLIPFPFIIYIRAAMIFHQSPSMCRFLNVFMHVGEMASIVLLMAFTLDSYLAAYPQHNPLSSRRKTMIVTSTVAWVLAAAIGIAAVFLAYSDHYEVCWYGPLIGGNAAVNIIAKVFVLLVIPLVVVWVFVGLTLRRRSYETPSETSPEPKEEEKGGPNRRLLLGLASSFTVFQGIYLIFDILSRYVAPTGAFVGFSSFVSSLTHFDRAVNAILVICLSEELRQRAADWLHIRRAASVPLQDM